MSDLTDDELNMATTVSDRLQAINHRAYVDRESLGLADRLQRAAVEIRRHRATMRKLIALRNEWRARESSHREWLVDSFVDDLDNLVTSSAVTDG